jgi:ribose transport system ATP-binding protein
MKLTMRGIHKSFDANHVLKDVDFSVRPGEIHALLGENGAGKSTLMNILGGVLRADAGAVELDERPVRFHTPRESLEAGIGFIHQELNLVNDLYIYENMFIGREIKTFGVLNRRAMIEQSQAVFDRMGVRLDPRLMVRTLDASYKQIVEIARALMMNAGILIMDEPTTSLTDVEISRVFDMMRTLKGQGVGIVFISHKLREVMEICDRYTVLRDGEKVAQGEISDTNVGALARHMVGHEIRAERLTVGRAAGGELLRAERLTCKPYFEDVSFAIRGGEIVGFTGLLGDGRSELFQAVFGITEYAGRLFIGGEAANVRGSHVALRYHIGYVPRNRKENGIIQDLSILENSAIVTLKELRTGPLLSARKELNAFDEQKQRLHIKHENPRDLITSLSGGNQQKVVLAKWLAARSRVLIFDNPTQGVDVGAKEEIYDIIIRLAREGVAIAVLSSEAQEIVRIASRALVMYHGHVQGELADEALTEHNIMLLATGGKA